MYFYVSEPLTTSVEKRKIDEIKSTLSQLGIAGEFAVASPARTVEEHLELAFKKGFTSIVAIGSDALASKVASTMFRHHYDRAALGVIPLNQRQLLWSLTGAISVQQICQSLRTRHLLSVDLIELNSDQVFLTEASIQLTKPVRFRLHYNQALLLGQFTHLTIANTGETSLWDESRTSGSGFLDRILGRSNRDKQTVTHFVSDRWQFQTEQPCPVLIDNAVVTETPLTVQRHPKALKLIINRATISGEKEKE